MKIGTRSILFGCHQVLWHPITVWLAWHKLYKTRPTWREAIAIFCHDLGYWGLPNIDGPEGKKHPFHGAYIAARVVGWLEWRRGSQHFPRWGAYAFDIERLALYHSRDIARIHERPVSKLCMADKFSIFFDPAFFYLWRTRLSGELAEFKQRAIASGHIPAGASDCQWLNFYRQNVLARPEIQALLAPSRRGLGFVTYPNWGGADHRVRIWYAFRSDRIDGPVCTTKAAALVNWFASRFFPGNK